VNEWATITYPRSTDPNDQLGELRIPYRKDLSVARRIKERGLSGWQAATTATLLAACERTPSSAFFDVGANVGIYSALHARLWSDASTVAFEPTPHVAESGSAITKENGLAIQWERVAVSDTAGEATLYLSARSDASNSLERKHRQPKGVVTVPTVTLDDYVSSSGLVPSVVKIDVEQHESAVLRGGAKLLEMRRPVVVAELLPNRGDSEVVQSLLAGHGYHARHISPPAGAAAAAEDDLRDWLFWPGTPPAEFDQRFREWYTAVARCVPVP
jgi:FkbM family methyltransferase